MAAKSRVFFASMVGTVWIAVYDGLARIFSDKSVEMSLSGSLVALGVALFVGALIGAAISVLLAAAQVRGPARAISMGAVENLANVPWWAVAAAMIAFAAPLIAAVPLRAKLLEKESNIAGAIDLAALAIGWILFLVVSRSLGKRSGKRIGGATAGWGCVAAAAIAAGLFIGQRPFLNAADVWTLVLIGDFAVAVLGVALLIPTAFLTKRALAAAAAVALIAGCASSFALNRSESVREETASDWRPVSLFVSSATALADFDGDGFSPIFGGGDCNDFAPDISPEGIEIAGNGIDENCRDGDRETKLPWPKRPAFVPLPQGIREPRSIVLIVVDAMRRDRLGVYGYPKPTSPRIDALALQSVVFTNAYSSAPTTRVAIPILHTGRFLAEIPWNRRQFPYALRDEADTVAEILKKERQVVSAAFVTHRFLGKKWGWNQGFDVVDEEFVLPRTEYENVATGEALSAKVAAWIESHAKDRFFTYVHFLDPHVKYLKHEGAPEFGDDPAGRYDGEIWYSDRAIGVILDKLSELGIAEDTMVIVMADHGEYLGEHGLKAHGGSVWQEAAQIPLVIRAPGLAARKSDCIMGHVDLAPTILNFMGIDGGKYGMTGASLVPEMTGASCPGDREVVLEIRYGRLGAPNVQALVGKRWKLIANVHKGTYKLYDLENDPMEEKNVSGKYASKYREMKDRLLSWNEVYAGKERAQIMRELVSDELPGQAERVTAAFENGIEIVGVEFGERRVVGDDAPDYQIYFKARKRETRACLIHFYLVDENGDTRFDTKHPPVAGTFPFERWPLQKIVNDGFSLELFGSLMVGGKLQDGRYDARIGITCDDDTVRAKSGDVDSEGRAKAGYIEVVTSNDESKGGGSE